MSLKNRILIILIITAIASAVVSGLILTFLVQLFGEITFDDGSSMVIAALASALYLIGGLVIVGLLDIQMNKAVIVPELEKKKLESERTMLSNQLHQSQKMEAVGRLAGSIAHDFNNLLTIIDGYASLIVADPQGEETEQHVKEIVEAARKASFITRKLLGFSQKEKAELVLLDLNTTLEDTNKMLSRLIGEKITLVTKSYAEPVFVEADPVQLGQILMNLAVNARDAMPNGGRIIIKIDCRDVKDGECGKPDKLPAGSYVEISVRDTGHGMDAETISQIFEAFFTTKESGKGTGLGLSIVKGIMKESNGFIDVKSKVGAGTTFFIYLPLAEWKEEELIKEEAGVEPAVELENEPEALEDVGSATILLVEDDPMIRNLICQTLGQQDFNVLLADEGWEGVKVARNHKGNIDLLFTDVVMPGLGGAELAVAARELYPDIKVLYTSGYSRSQLVEEGVPPDADVLEKPFTPDKAVAMVRRLLATDRSN
jgi:signal transduction histidine kinase